MVQWVFFSENASLAAENTAISSSAMPLACWYASAASSPFMFGTSTGNRVPGRRAIADSTSAVPAICGTHLGDTNAPDSTIERPADASRSISATRVATGMLPGSFCSPSRGPTSTTRTAAGSTPAIFATALTASLRRPSGRHAFPGRR